MHLLKKSGLILGVFIFSVFFGFSQTNLLKNPSFEDSFVIVSESFDEWYIHFDTEREKVSDATDGTFAVKIKTNRSRSSGFFAELSAAKPSNDLQFVQGQAYTISFDYKVLSGTITELRSTILEDNLYLAYEEILTDQVPNGWQTMTYSVIAGKTTDYNFDINFKSDTGTTEIIIDNARIAEKSDRDTLLALYAATDGAEWTNKWDVNADISTWYGITVNADNRVTQIRLNSNNLKGNLPAAIGDLDELIKIDLSPSYITGRIDNQLSGAIPMEFWNLTKLEEINFESLGLSGTLPSEIGQLTNIKKFEVDNNGFSGPLPVEIGQLSDINSLVLSNNQFTGNIPIELGNLSKVRMLTLYNNNFTGSIPSVLFQLTDLTTLNLGSNKLTGPIPNGIGQLTRLRYLDLSYNNFGGSLPPELGQLADLEILYLGNAELEGAIPTELGQMSSIEQIGLSSNNLTGPIPASFGQLGNLVRLVLFDNQLTGNIPSSLGQLTELGFLDVSQNGLEGTVPSFAYENMYGLSLQRNSFVFEDFKALLNVHSSLRYGFQSKLGERLSLTRTKGEDFSISVTETSDPDNTYQWRKNGAAIPNATSATLTISNVTAGDSGSYDCLIKNTEAPYLSLEKNAIRLKVLLPDADNDGVENDNDDCPNTPLGESVDENGCSQSQLDDDNDGITNDLDQCADTIVGEPVNAKGCSQSQLVNIEPTDIRLQVSSTSCPNKSNGKIAILFEKDYSYSVSVASGSINQTYADINANTGFSLSELAAGDYEVCVTIPEFPSFEQCFYVNVETPEDFKSGKIRVANKKKKGNWSYREAKLTS